MERAQSEIDQTRVAIETLQAEFMSEVPNLKSAVGSIRTLKTEIKEVKELVIVHSKAFEDIDHYMEERRKAEKKDPVQAVFGDSKMLGLQSKVEELQEHQ